MLDKVRLFSRRRAGVGRKILGLFITASATACGARLVTNHPRTAEITAQSLAGFVEDFPWHAWDLHFMIDLFSTASHSDTTYFSR